MSHVPSSRRGKRCLLLGCAGAALAAMLVAVPAAAQADDAHVAAAHLLVSEQSSRAAPALVDATQTATQALIAGDVQDARAVLADNSATATARANRAVSGLTLDRADLASGYGPTYLSAGAAGLTANAGTLVATSQRSILSPVEATLLGSRIALDAGTASGSALEVSRNALEAIALGNDATGSLALTGLSSNAGAGILSLQTTDASSTVAARARTRTEISTLAVSDSSLTMVGNLDRAIGYGNAVDNALSVNAVDIDAPRSADAPSVVPYPDGDPVAAAAYSVLATQLLGGAVKARAGGVDGLSAFGVIVSGDAQGSSVTNDGNTLVSAGYGNQSANRLGLDAVSITRPSVAEGSNGGAVADITAVQRIADANVVGTMTGGMTTNILGDIAGSSVSASGNGVHALATGNQADGNLLAVRAGTIDVPRGNSSGGPAGAVFTSIDGAAVATSAFGVQNVQDYGRGTIGAAVSNGAATLQASGAIDGSMLRADGNDAVAGATGNSAVNGATLQATALRASVGVNNVQTGDGDVLVLMGSADAPGGATIAPDGAVRDSHLSISANHSTGTAIGNTATNSLAIDADAIADGSGLDAARAGPLSDGYGAEATFALASDQKLGQPSLEGGTAVQIASTVIGRFAVTGDGNAARSSLDIDGNAQRSNAIGNSATNRLSVSATSLDGLNSPAAGSALSSAQYGEADISAVSMMKVAAKGAVADSAISLSGNSNQALATVNDVDNGLSFDAAQSGTAAGGDTHAAIGAFGSPDITGDHVLGNVQFATGSASAAAETRLANSDTGGGLVGSRVAVEDNVTSADASANRAVNAVDMSTGSGRGPAGDLASMQMSVAGVTASAVTNAAYVVTATPAADNSSVSIGGNTTTALARGNVADNKVTVSTGSSEPLPSAAVATTSRYDMSADAAAPLLNFQSNYGAVTATAASTGYGVPLNGVGAAVVGSSIAVNGNSTTAAAYGNAANNVVTASTTGRLPTAAVVNVQVNYGPVSALVTDAGYRVATGPLGASALAITGNQLAATATGNQATNLITVSR